MDITWFKVDIGFGHIYSWWFVPQIYNFIEFKSLSDETVNVSEQALTTQQNNRASTVDAEEQEKKHWNTPQRQNRKRKKDEQNWGQNIRKTKC